MQNVKYVLALIILFSFGLAFAHPASEQTVTFDKTKGNLTIAFDHKVKDAGDHFIFDVKVLLNKKVIITQKISKQESLNGGTLIYRIPEMKSGDKISVVTECNKGGKKSTNVDIK